MTNLPQARGENIVVQEADKELLLYDLTTNKAYCLNETSAIIYRHCDGKTLVDDLKREYQFTDDLIYFALDGLKKEKLIIDDFVSPLKGLKRREIIKKIGLASITALPLISAIIAPTAIQAAASCGGTSPMGTFLGCTEFESQCLNMNQMCISCSTMAAIVVGPGACSADFPYLCVCD